MRKKMQNANATDKHAIVLWTSDTCFFPFCFLLCRLQSMIIYSLKYSNRRLYEHNILMYNIHDT